MPVRKRSPAARASARATSLDDNEPTTIALGARLAELDHDPLAGRAIVSRSRKLQLTAQCMLRSLAEAPRRAPEELWGGSALPPERHIEFPRDILPLGSPA